MRRRRRTRARSPSGSAIPCSSGPRTSSAAGACRSLGARTELALDGPALVDRFLEGALELDVDVLCDGETAGWRRSSSTSSAPASTRATRRASSPRPRSAPRSRRRSGSSPRTLAHGLGARGLLNLQLALHDGELHVLEANPRASRTVPFVAKATGIPLVDHACRLLLGDTARRARAARASRRRRGPGRRRRSSRRSASPAPPTAASRCARPAR